MNSGGVFPWLLQLSQLTLGPRARHGGVQKILQLILGRIVQHTMCVVLKDNVKRVRLQRFRSAAYNSIFTSHSFSEWTIYLVIWIQQTTHVTKFFRFSMQNKSKFAEKGFVFLVALCTQKMQTEIEILKWIWISRIMTDFKHTLQVSFPLIGFGTYSFSSSTCKGKNVSIKKYHTNRQWPPLPTPFHFFSSPLNY